mmetsp:Transcript_82111/g.160218  ORF Transcript_82111/g.160218 Transcript_82111/m.160218 type:complete len:273 (+) Transcript_82111:483-1301(+)
MPTTRHRAGREAARAAARRAAKSRIRWRVEEEEEEAGAGAAAAGAADGEGERGESGGSSPTLAAVSHHGGGATANEVRAAHSFSTRAFSCRTPTSTFRTSSDASPSSPFLTFLAALSTAANLALSDLLFLGTPLLTLLASFFFFGTVLVASLKSSSSPFSCVVLLSRALDAALSAVCAFGSSFAFSVASSVSSPPSPLELSFSSTLPVASALLVSVALSPRGSRSASRTVRTSESSVVSVLLLTVFSSLPTTSLLLLLLLQAARLVSGPCWA